MRRISVLACISSVLVAGAAHAAGAADARSEFAACTAIVDAAERLKCFDAAAQRPAQPAARDEDFGKPPPRPEVAQITATVREFARSARGRAVFLLDNGQTWRQLDADGAEVREPPPGKAMRVTIEKGFLDSYNLTVEGRNGFIKVRRVK